MVLKPLSLNQSERQVREFFEIPHSSPCIVVGTNRRPLQALEHGVLSSLKDLDLFEIEKTDFLEDLADFLMESARFDKVPYDDPQKGWEFLLLSREGENVAATFEFGWVYAECLYEDSTVEDLKSRFNISVAAEEDLEPGVDIEDDDPEPLEKLRFSELDMDTKKILFKAAFIQELSRIDGDFPVGPFVKDREAVFKPLEDNGDKQHNLDLPM